MTNNTNCNNKFNLNFFLNEQCKDAISIQHFIENLNIWEREHPEAFECDTQDNIDYMRISSESLGGFNSTDTIKLNKIIKHVVKEVYVK